ncbi:MAG: 50S ribosomal protein L35 [Prevotellaceae bacterium]|jgi:large subunit ribosomal protein L35|nr:50S ribosomal protein L35 [Prevotellaceae bacterium]
MPKMKTNSGAKKRFDVTGTGKIKRKHAYKRHILTKKTTKQKRSLTHFGIIADVDKSRVKKMLVM